MKYCRHCGGELEDEALVCIHCGRSVEESKPQKASNANLGKIALIFMILSCAFAPISGIFNYFTAENVAMGIGYLVGSLISLAWCIPMTIHFASKLKKGESVGVGFKVCSLLFVSLIAGILMLCMPKEDNQ